MNRREFGRLAALALGGVTLAPSSGVRPASNFAGVILGLQGHFVAAGFDPVSYIAQNHGSILLIHVKDRKKKGPNTPFGEGDTPIQEVLKLIRDRKYPIKANIEYEYQGADTMAEVRKCFDYCKQALMS
jgi:sugar phosphate isomerase/epimerase